MLTSRWRSRRLCPVNGSACEKCQLDRRNQGKRSRQKVEAEGQGRRPRQKVKAKVTLDLEAVGSPEPRPSLSPSRLSHRRPSRRRGPVDAVPPPAPSYLDQTDDPAVDGWGSCTVPSSSNGAGPRREAVEACTVPHRGTRRPDGCRAGTVLCPTVEAYLGHRLRRRMLRHPGGPIRAGRQVRGRDESVARFSPGRVSDKSASTVVLVPLLSSAHGHPPVVAVGCAVNGISWLFARVHHRSQCRSDGILNRSGPMRTHQDQLTAWGSGFDSPQLRLPVRRIHPR